MGTTLTGTTPATTYDSLIKVTDNGPIGTSLKTLTDGLGNDSALALSSLGLKVNQSATVITAAASLQHFSNNYFYVRGGASGLIMGDDGLSNRIQFDDNASVIFEVGSVERLRITSTGNVGIGTSAPASALHVLGTQFRIEANDPTITLKRNVAAAFGGHIDWLTNDNTLGFQIANNALVSAEFLEFNHSGVNRMVIKSDGNVGIGTSAPTEPLHVVGDARVTNLGVNFAAQADARIFVYDNSANSGLVIQQDGASGIIAKFNGSGGATKVRIDSDGLKFGSDVAAANALDDYEEGTWTMGVSFGGASVGVTTSANTGTYTKIGRQVTVNGYLVLTSKGSSTGDARITGLPFGIPNSVQNFAPASLWFAAVTYANQFQGYGLTNTTTIDLREITEAGVEGALTNADFANNSRLMVSFTYFV